MRSVERKARNRWSLLQRLPLWGNSPVLSPVRWKAGVLSVAGTVGFVGLVVPHVARTLAGPDHRWVLPLSMVLAPALLVLADTAGRLVLPPGEVSAGTMTAVLGAPVFLWLVHRSREVGL